MRFSHEACRDYSFESIAHAATAARLFFAAASLDFKAASLPALPALFSAGLGLRFVFPQFDRTALRLDFGFPFSARPLPGDVPRFSFYVAFHQAVALPVVGAGKGP